MKGIYVGRVVGVREYVDKKSGEWRHVSSVLVDGRAYDVPLECGAVLEQVVIRADLRTFEGRGYARPEGLSVLGVFAATVTDETLWDGLTVDRKFVDRDSAAVAKGAKADGDS